MQALLELIANGVHAQGEFREFCTSARGQATFRDHHQLLCQFLKLKAGVEGHLIWRKLRTVLARNAHEVIHGINERQAGLPQGVVHFKVHSDLRGFEVERIRVGVSWQWEPARHPWTSCSLRPALR